MIRVVLKICWQSKQLSYRKECDHIDRYSGKKWNKWHKNMLIHNKRLHPRRPGDHYHGCMLHDMQEEPASPRRSKSPTSRSRSQTPSSSSLHSSSTALYDRRSRHKSATSASNSALNSPRTPTAPTLSWCTSTYNKRNSLGAFPTNEHQINSLFYDVVDAPTKPSLKSSAAINNSNAKQKSKSTICLNSSLSPSASETGKSEKRSNTVTFKCYDSPDEIIANLFPGIGDATDAANEPKFLRKGHGAAQMAKTRSTPRDWSSAGRSSSATGNYAAPSATNTKHTSANSERKTAAATRSLSTHSDNSCRKTYVNGRLYSVERDFDNMGCVYFFSLSGYALIARLISRVNVIRWMWLIRLRALSMHASVSVCRFACFLWKIRNTISLNYVC